MDDTLKENEGGMQDDFVGCVCGDGPIQEVKWSEELNTFV